jgi:hypothetical protein
LHIRIIWYEFTVRRMQGFVAICAPGRPADLTQNARFPSILHPVGQADRTQNARFPSILRPEGQPTGCRKQGFLAFCARSASRPDAACKVSYHVAPARPADLAQNTKFELGSAARATTRCRTRFGGTGDCPLSNYRFGGKGGCPLLNKVWRRGRLPGWLVIWEK